LNSAFLGGVKLGALGGDVAHAVSLQCEPMCVVDETIEDRIGDGWIADGYCERLDGMRIVGLCVSNTC
jgi:hypothetical protein